MNPTSLNSIFLLLWDITNDVLRYVCMRGIKVPDIAKEAMEVEE